jgi:hypothetical protein
MELETKKLAQEGFWATVSPGSLVYLKTQGESQHGYDQYSHVAAFLGHDEYQKPIFGEYSPAMKKGPEIDRSLEQVLKMYHGNLPSLTTTIVDVPKIAAEMWKRKLEAVVPNSKALIEAGYTSFLTININNGLATNWEVNKEGQPEPREFADGSKELYCVVGRNLLSKIGLTEKYNTLIEKISSFDKYANLKHSSYDSTNAILRGTPLDVPRYCLTPPLMFEVSDFSLVGNFGHLGGSTDIAIMQVLEEKDGKVVKVDEISNYTIHATPQGTDSQQDLLLRDELLNEANKVGKPLPPNKVHLTSGCANFTPEVFKIIKRSLLHDKNKKTAVIFSYPDFPQDTQLNNGAFTYARDPLGGSLNRLWDYTEL